MVAAIERRQWTASSDVARSRAAFIFSAAAAGHETPEIRYSAGCYGALRCVRPSRAVHSRHNYRRRALVLPC